jgi:hypothetical protein
MRPVTNSDNLIRTSIIARCVERAFPNSYSYLPIPPLLAVLTRELSEKAFALQV